MTEYFFENLAMYFFSCKQVNPLGANSKQHIRYKKKEWNFFKMNFFSCYPVFINYPIMWHSGFPKTQRNSHKLWSSNVLKSHSKLFQNLCTKLNFTLGLSYFDLQFLIFHRILKNCQLLIVLRMFHYTQFPIKSGLIKMAEVQV